MESFFEFRHVYKGFDGRVILHDVSFDVRPGETVCIMGRSGVGKSVTLKLIMGFLKPDSGQIIADGIDVPALTEAELTQMHKKITMVFQSGALFDSLTVFDNVAFPLREREHESEAEVESTVSGLLSMLDLNEHRDDYPASLSTGMKRAVAIARALAARPKAILYDEPTTMVDPLMSHTIAELIQRVKRQYKLTSIVVTHDTSLARKLADRLIMLHEGGVRFFGTIEEMDASQDPIVQEFLQQDELALP
ncbi:MAG TPA: ATP-binding cassette domain-containing protein [Terriglobales bacterium]|nr:ATP-binding cassette domain-containing protein [Terriglobales bacterium]